MAPTNTTTLTPCACGSTTWTVELSALHEDRWLILDPETGTLELENPCAHDVRQVSLDVTCEECGARVAPDVLDLMVKTCPGVLAW